MEESSVSTRRWLLRGVGGAATVPALILFTSMAGFGVLCRETGLTFWQSVFMTSAIFALPSQVILVGAIGAGATLATASLGVALSAIRLLPMVASWLPMLKAERAPRWQLVILSHSVAVTAWVVSALQLPKVPEAGRYPYFVAFAATLVLVSTVVTGLAYVAAGVMPPVLAGMLFFLTPVYFLVALTRSSRLHAEKLALVAGLALGPLFRWSEVPLDLVWTGIAGGTLAYLGHRLIRARR